MERLRVRGDLHVPRCDWLNVFYKAPIECYIMQGEYPLPESVVEKFAKTGGELCKNVFLLSALYP